MKKYFEKNVFEKLFVVIVLFSLLISLITVAIHHGNTWENYFYEDIADGFMDMFNSIYHANSREVYTSGAIYPPLVYAIYLIIGLFVPNIYIKHTYNLVAMTFEGQIIMVFFILFCIFMSIYLLPKFIDSKYKKLIILAFLLSFPFLHMIQRGNIIILAFLFTVLYFIFYDSKNKYLKELSLISLAIAFNIKLYPCIFGLLLLKDKRYKDALRCTIYALFLLIVPFIFFGGFNSIISFFNNVFCSSDLIPIVSQKYLINISSTLNMVSKFMGIKIFSNTELIINIFLLLNSLVIFVLSNKKWQKILILTLIFICFPSYSYTYIILFLFIPLVYLFKDNDNKIINKISFILLTLLFCSYGFIPKIGIYSSGVVMERILLLVLLLVTIFDGYFEYIKCKKGALK